MHFCDIDIGIDPVTASSKLIKDAIESKPAEDRCHFVPCRHCFNPVVQHIMGGQDPCTVSLPLLLPGFGLGLSLHGE
jgi:hypothetical protein